MKQRETFINKNSSNLKDLARGEVDENVRRKSFTLSEMVAIWLAMESHQGRLPSDSDGSKDRMGRASKILGISTDTLSKTKQVIDYAEEKDRPELVKEMDESGNVKRIYTWRRYFKAL